MEQAELTGDEQRAVAGENCLRLLGGAEGSRALPAAAAASYV
jgi:hypothetical protein